MNEEKRMCPNCKTEMECIDCTPCDTYPFPKPLPGPVIYECLECGYMVEANPVDQEQEKAMNDEWARHIRECEEEAQRWEAGR